jgi:uncharacterized protein YbjQ (UPF0145 family)
LTIARCASASADASDNPLAAQKSSADRTGGFYINLVRLAACRASIAYRSRRIAASRARGYGFAMDMENSPGKFIVSTMNDLPGYEVTQVLGEVFGLVVRARNAFSNFGASLRTVFGGEAKGYTQLLSDSRNQALERLKLAAMERGGNAVLAMRFDCNEIADLMSEIAAYGTAVIVRKK